MESLWSRAGGPGAAFAVTDGALYGASGAGVFASMGTGSDWTRIGGPATTITGGP